MENQEVKKDTKKLWFKRKLYGWGWTPSTWQGWALTAGYILVVLGVTKIITNRALRGDEVGLFSLPIILGTTIIFIFIIYKKGEKPRWQWGVDKGDE